MMPTTRTTIFLSTQTVAWCRPMISAAPWRRPTCETAAPYLWRSTAAPMLWPMPTGGCDLGNYPPTSAQIECMAQVVAVIAAALDIPIDLPHVMTHAEAADNLDGLYPCDPYGPAHTCERWDLAVVSEDEDWMTGGNTVRGKALFYQQQGV